MMDIRQFEADIDFLKPIQGQTILIEYLELLFDDGKITMNIDIRCRECRLSLQFKNVSALEIPEVRQHYQIAGIHILDNSGLGWQNDVRYTVEDYEEGLLRFNCEDILIRCAQTVD